jgi:hypothetical protein
LKHRQRVIPALCAAVLSTCICGCSLSSWKASTVSVTGVAAAPAEASAVRDQERRFAGALVFLRAGKEQEARDLLELVVAAPPRSGMTDEALFRLSLLYLPDDSAKGTERTQELLKRLIDEFPRSIWAHQAAPLAAYLTGVRTLRDKQREVRTLKELNLSLSRDNREMRQSIERLKNLDMELEKKIKR